MVSGITINLLDPQLTIFFFAFLPQSVRPGPGAVAPMLALSGVFMARAFVVLGGRLAVESR